MGIRQILLNGAVTPSGSPYVMKSLVPLGTNTFPAVNWYAVRKDFTAVSEAWLSFDWAMDADTTTDFLVPAGGAVLGGYGDVFDDLGNYFFPELNGGNYWNLSGGGNAESTTPTIVANTWFSVEIHVSVGGNLLELYVNSDLIATTDQGGGSPLDHIAIGNMQNSGTAHNSTLWFRNVKVGTTQGGSDIFADDFSSGNLSSWDTVFNDCTVVLAPF